MRAFALASPDAFWAALGRRRASPALKDELHLDACLEIVNGFFADAFGPYGAEIGLQLQVVPVEIIVQGAAELVLLSKGEGIVVRLHEGIAESDFELLRYEEVPGLYIPALGIEVFVERTAAEVKGAIRGDVAEVVFAHQAKATPFQGRIGGRGPHVDVITGKARPDDKVL